jgi:hypothetical protein
VKWIDHDPLEEEVRRALDDVYGELKGVRVNTRRRHRRKKLEHERKGAKGRRSPVIDYVRSLGDYLTTHEVAAELGMSTQWVRKAAEKRWTQAPSYVAPFGETHVNLYTKEDVQALRDYLATNRKVLKREDWDKETT